MRKQKKTGRKKIKQKTVQQRTGTAVRGKRSSQRTAKYYQERRKKRLIGLAALAILLLGGLHWMFQVPHAVDLDEDVQELYIEQDGHSRTGWKLNRVKDIVIHYVANPGSSARANRDYFNSPTSSVSAHFIVGLDGEIIQCIPLEEQSSASNNRNKDTISIEVCHPDDTGKFNRTTYHAVVQLTAALCRAYHLDEDDVIRHYDITGKNCPKYFVENPNEWEKLKEDVKGKI